MNKQHKWAKEIKAWADGAEIEVWYEAQQEWIVDSNPDWNFVSCKYRIKPQPKEPQYLYVYQDKYGVPHFRWSKIEPLKTDLTYQGKIKLEQDDE